MGRREKLTEFNRNNILLAAKALFESKGFEQTTVDDIATEADCSKSTLYVYFKSKDEIYYSIVFSSMCLLKEKFEVASRIDSGFENTFYYICNMLTEFKNEYPIYFTSILSEISVDEEDFERLPVLHDIYTVGEEINSILLELIIKGVESGSLRKDLKPIPTIFTMWASLGGIIQMAEQKEKYFENKLGMPKREYLEYSFKILLDSIKEQN